jgi:type I restriction-modification system DNA methylase subunit
MSLFQTSVVHKWLNDLDSDLINNKYAQFQSFFGDPVRQENIRNSKEEQFQEGFLRELFVKVFGYTLNPEPDYNLTTELKNIANSKKADGAILKGKDAIGVIELKGTDTTDLDKIETQAFGYKNHHPKCVYVITSNFEKLRFYIQDAVDHIDFDLFNLSQEDFSLMWLCLAKDNLLNGIPQKIKDSSLLQEENITKKLYADYSKFREEIYNNLVENNPDKDKLLLFKKTQKLLDRFLFIFFAEDRLLLPPNSISEIVKQWNTLKDLDAYVPLYNRFKMYFGYMNTGYKGKKYDIFAYNGGLFAPDEILDNISIDDDILHKHTLTLSQYDFETDVDVNILGHIFEHSLGEIENVQAEIKGEKIDTQKTKRKKDGIFYTPKYITKYIVENTVGKLCKEKRSELDIVDEEYAKGRRNRKKSTIKTLDEKLTTYRDWLLSLTILDPACGSGAFLNQALDFLITEHRKIDYLRAQLLGGSIVFSDITTDILEKNIYGVDLNEESVEIAKLSLWLRTAQKGRKLNKLNNNIKCGNSLIDDPEMAGEKAFKWKNEFPQVFANGGFDVVIGNPPYGAKLPKNIQSYLNNKYIKGGAETAISFIKLSYDNLLKPKGNFGFIIPKSFSFASNYKAIREYVFNDINKIVDCKKVWKEVKLEQVIFFFTKNFNSDDYISAILNGNHIDELGIIEKVTFKEFGFYLNGISEEELRVGKKINKNKRYIKDIATNSRGGIFQKHITDYGDTKVLGGAEIQRERINGVKGYVNKSVIESDTNCFIKDNSVLVQNIVAHIENPIDHIKITACFPENKDYLIVDTINQITFDKKYNAKVFWLLFNSKLINWYTYRFILGKAIRTIHFDSPITNRIPITESINQHPFIEKADQMLFLNKGLFEKTTRFINRIKVNFDLQKISSKLEKFYDFDFKAFAKELRKQKIEFSLLQQDEWEDYFNTYKSEINQIQSEIEKTDKEIDQMVYELYGLTDDEIAIIENS